MPRQTVWLHTCTGSFFHDLYSSEFFASCFLQQAFVVIRHIIWATNFFHHFRTFLNAFAFLFASVVVHAARERSMTPFLALQKYWKHWESEKYSVEPVLTDTLVIRTPINLGKFLVSLRIQHFFFKKKKTVKRGQQALNLDPRKQNLSRLNLLITDNPVRTRLCFM